MHKLSDIIMIALCAVLSGIEDWVGMEEFAEEKEAWLRGFLQLPNGIPSHDTLSDVLGRIDPSAFAEAFTRWVQAALPTLSGQQVCLDGKTLRGSRDGDKAVHLMSAFAAQARWVLTQQQKPEWAGLQAVGRVESTRIIDGKTSVENRYYLCSFTDLTRFAEGVRQHWSIENQQHWVLDVQFGEDAHRARKDHSAENLALIRRTALNLLRCNGPVKDSLKRRKLRACLNDHYRFTLLFGSELT